MMDVSQNANADAEGIERRNRYRDAPRDPIDYTIDQDWSSYSEKEHDRWDRLFARQTRVLQTRACQEFVDALDLLRLSQAGIPNMERLSDRLEPLTGWRVVPVADLVPDDVFFNHLAERRFPAGAFIRPESELDYLQEPDVFHDIFGHVPMLADPVFADFMQAYGKGGQRAMERGMLKNLARVYWYTVEFGLVQSANGVKLFGAGIMSSATESEFALDSDSPHRIEFDLKRVMRTNYIIDDFQQSYFVIDSFEKLLNECYQDFELIYDYLATSKSIEPDQIIETDSVINRGTLQYFDKEK
jgi:phenylalanine-4-hydroxylase